MSPDDRRRHDMNRTFLCTLPDERWGGGLVRGDRDREVSPGRYRSKDGTSQPQARHSALGFVRVIIAVQVLRAVALVSALTIVLPTVASAATNATASTDPTGAHVHLARRGVWVEVRAPADASGGGGSGVATGCLRRWVPTKYPHHLQPGKVDPDIHPTPMPPSPGPEYVAYHVYCGATYLDSVWLAPSAFAPAAGALDVCAIAQEIARDLPYPPTAVHVSPDGRGLTGLQSWFWVSGYAGPVHDIVNELGMQVEVEAAPAAVRWDFGDGSPVQPGSLGVAAPSRSDVVHTYERRSTGRPMGIRASVRLDVRYRVDGAPWEALDPVFRTAVRAYPVVESRAALVPAR
jgi:hypothetical protein